MKHKLALSLGPILFFWSKKQIINFYQKMIDQPLDTIYLGEAVCSNRQTLSFDDWFCLARDIACAGKKVVFSSQVLLSTQSDFQRLQSLVGQDVFKIEANDMAAVKLAKEQGLTFVAGPTLNIYNEQSLELFRKLGAVRWIPPVEMSAQKLQIILNTSPPIDCEVFGWGKLPLAFSSHCFTSRYYQMSKDKCGVKCQAHPEGITVKAGDGDSLLSLNGAQTLSANHHSLLSHYQQMNEMGIKLLRLSPQHSHMEEVIQIHHAAINQRVDIIDAVKQLQAFVDYEMVDGYWQGQPGFVTVKQCQIP